MDSLLKSLSYNGLAVEVIKLQWISCWSH